MKRMLAILGSLGLTATAGLSVVACGKSNSQFNTFMDYVNETKGSYDNQGLPKSKSSASVIVIGAKDNGSSQSFQYALEKTFDSLELAKTALNREVEVKTTSTYSFSKTIENSSLTLQANEVGDLKFSRFIKVQFNNQTFDGGISLNGSDYQVNFKETDFSSSTPIEVKLTGYDYGPVFDGNSISSAWNSAYFEWLTKPNGDRSIRNIDLNLDTDSKKFGQVSATGKEEPVYGIKGDTEKGLLTTALDYAKIKFSLKTLMVDKVSDYWNSDLFKNLTNDYLKKDLMYQFTADPHNAPTKNDKAFITRQTAINGYLSKIKEARGPLFFIIKNGHVVKIMKGWTRYQKFGNQNSNENEDTFSENLKSWINELTSIMNQSFFDNNRELFSNDSPTIKTWQFADGENKDDSGASNWDPKKEEPTS